MPPRVKSSAYFPAPVTFSTLSTIGMRAPIMDAPPREGASKLRHRPDGRWPLRPLLPHAKALATGQDSGISKRTLSTELLGQEASGGWDRVYCTLDRVAPNCAS